MNENEKINNNLEDQIKRMEEIINQLNDAQLPLEQLLSLYNEGIKIGDKCTEELLKAKQIINNTQ